VTVGVGERDRGEKVKGVCRPYAPQPFEEGGAAHVKSRSALTKSASEPGTWAGVVHHSTRCEAYSHGMRPQRRGASADLSGVVLAKLGRRPGGGTMVHARSVVRDGCGWLRALGRVGLVSVLAFVASCIASPIPGELNCTPADDSTQADRTAQAQQPDTAAECYAEWRAMEAGCLRDPDLEGRRACLLAAHYILLRCLRTD